MRRNVTSHASAFGPVSKHSFIHNTNDIRVIVIEPCTAHAGTLLVDRDLDIRNLLGEPTAVTNVQRTSGTHPVDPLPDACKDAAVARADDNDLDRLVLVDAEVTRDERPASSGSSRSSSGSSGRRRLSGERAEDGVTIV